MMRCRCGVETLELRHLRYFIAVVNARHVGRAAEKLRVSQPALSQQLRDLEQMVGGQLFERHSRGMRLTPVGAALVEPARAALAAATSALERARAAAGGHAGRFVFGLPEASGNVARLRSALDLLRGQFPDLRVDTSGLPWLSQPHALLAGDIDAGFCWSPAACTSPLGIYPAGISALRLADDPGEYALLPIDHPAAAFETVPVSELCKVPFGLFDRSLLPALHDTITAEARRAGVTSIGPAEGVGTAAASAPLIVARAGWTLVTRSVAKEPPAGTIARRISGLAVDAGLDLIRRSDDGRAPIAFLEAALTKSFQQT